MNKFFSNLLLFLLIFGIINRDFTVINNNQMFIVIKCKKWYVLDKFCCD